MILGEPRVPFERPVQAGPGFIPRSLDTGFVAPERNPFPQVMAAQLLRMPSGVHQPLTAEPGVLPSGGPVAFPTTQPPSAAAIAKQRSMRLPIPLLIRMGMLPMPRTGIRAGLDPNKLVAGGRAPGL
jgi:hypothetical protein